MSIFTADEKEFIKIMEERKKKHNEAAQKYRAANKEKITEYNKKYNDSLKEKLNNILSKETNQTTNGIKETTNGTNQTTKEQPTPTAINIKEIAQETTTNINPAYKTRAEPLEDTTIDQYINKADILNRLYLKKIIITRY